jgi:hypothetical protein
VKAFSVAQVSVCLLIKRPGRLKHYRNLAQYMWIGLLQSSDTVVQYINTTHLTRQVDELTQVDSFKI